MLASAARPFDFSFVSFDDSGKLRTVPNWLLWLYHHAGTDSRRILDHRLSREPLLRSRTDQIRVWILGIGGPYFGPALLSAHVESNLSSVNQGPANPEIPPGGTALANRPWGILKTLCAD